MWSALCFSRITPTRVGTGYFMPSPLRSNINSGLIYDVSVSIDGYISGPNDDISQFPHSGPMVDDYLARRDNYQISVMGRATYEFGYAFGMSVGANPYPDMRTLVLSKTLSLPQKSDVEQIATDAVEYVRQLKAESDAPIYLCGGGALAESLAHAELIDSLILKRIPVILGGGTRLLGDASLGLSLTQTNFINYGEGLFLQTFRCNGLRK